MTIETDQSSPGPSPGTPNVGRYLCILHFNDCYNVEPQVQEPVGGAARFVTALRTFEHLNPLTLFSGDIIAPSIMSTFTKGEQMLPVMEKCSVDCALFGNHEFDFGLDFLVNYAKRTKFPWLMSNVFCQHNQQPLGEGQVTCIVERNGLKIGLMGLIEEEWLTSLIIDLDGVEYLDFIEEGRRLANHLRQVEKVDIVVALTHMRNHNDIKLAESVPEIDLILGGHDHVYDVRKVNGRYIIKSGTDFRQFSKIDIHFPAETSIEGATTPEMNIAIEEVNVTSDFGEDPWLAKELERYKTEIEEQMGNVVAMLECSLDGRFAHIRSQETNLGDLMADIMLDASIDGDLALINSGTLRSDKVHPSGPFRMRDLFNILPYMESLMVLEVTGDQIYLALENGVSLYPRLEGRFPQVAGVRFAFNSKRPPGDRVPFDSITVAGRALERDRKYRLVTKEYVALGRDGYDMLKECPVYKSPEQCMSMVQAVTEYLEALRLVQLKEDEAHGLAERRASLIGMTRRKSKQFDAEQIAKKIQVPKLCPKVDGRIQIVA